MQFVRLVVVMLMIGFCAGCGGGDNAAVKAPVADPADTGTVEAGGTGVPGRKTKAGPPPTSTERRTATVD